MERLYKFQICYFHDGVMQQKDCANPPAFQEQMKRLWKAHAQHEALRVYVYSQHGFERVNEYRRGNGDNWVMLK